MGAAMFGFGLGLGVMPARRSSASATGLPTFSSPPAISGGAALGDQLSATVVPASAGPGGGAVSHVWAWQRDGVDIPGETGTGTAVPGHALVAADAAASEGDPRPALRLRVTATDANGSRTAYSNTLAGPMLAHDFAATVSAGDAASVLGSLLDGADPSATAVTSAVLAGDALSLGTETDLSGHRGLATVAGGGSLSYDPVRDFLTLAVGASTTITGSFTLDNGGTGSITITINGEFTPPEAASTTVFLVAGQSNATGRADWDSGNPYPAGAYQWGRKNGNDGVIIPAIHPLEHAHNYQPNRFGWALEFARSWVAANPGRDILLVPAAYGGSSLHSGDWSKGGTLYEDAVDRTNAVMAANPDFAFGGILWHQGESDTGNTTNANAYRATRAQMVADMRADITVADGTTPFLAGGLAPGFVGSDSNHLIVQGVIERTAAEIEHSAHVSSAGLADSDGSHFDAAGMRLLGARYHAALSVAHGNVFATGGTTVEAVSVSGVAYRRHVFTGSGSFTVPAGLGPLDVQAIAIGGGAGGGGAWGGGGGAGRVVLAGPGAEIAVASGTSAVTVGAGGSGGGSMGDAGGTTGFAGLSAPGGGGGGSGGNPGNDGAVGANGGGAGGGPSGNAGTGAAGTDNNGGNGAVGGFTRAGGGGGGAGGHGAHAAASAGGAGGAGHNASAFGLGIVAGGGGGGVDARQTGETPGSGGSGGGGAGGSVSDGGNATGYGAGGGGGTWPSAGGGAMGGAGAAGAVVIQYPAAS